MLARTIMQCLVAVSLFSSCGILTNKQLDMVNGLSLRADSVTSAPTAIFSSLSEIRIERGLYYASSLSSAQARFEEVNALAKGALDDDKAIRKADAYISVFNSYLRLLRSLSNDERWKAVGREMRGVGKREDSLIVLYNKIELYGPLPEGVAKTAGKVFGTIGEQIMKSHRAKVLKDAVIQGDTLIAMCVDSLISVLRSDEMNSLIANEKAGLLDNYRVFLMSAESLGKTVDLEADRRYIELYVQMNGVSVIRNKCISALRSLKKAHHKLAESFGNEDAEDVFYELLEFNEIAAELCKQIKAL